MAILTVSGETGLPDLPPGGIETADSGTLYFAGFASLDADL